MKLVSIKSVEKILSKNINPDDYNKCIEEIESGKCYDVDVDYALIEGGIYDNRSYRSKNEVTILKIKRVPNMVTAINSRGEIFTCDEDEFRTIYCSDVRMNKYLHSLINEMEGKYK